MTETTNSARDQPTPKVDITPETIYNLIKLVEQNAPLLALLENHKPGPQDALKSEPKGASDMAKRHKQRVRIGTDEKGAAIYKWADGHTVEELNDNIVRLYIEHGLLRKFLDSHPNIVILDPKSKKDCPPSGSTPISGIRSTRSKSCGRPPTAATRARSGCTCSRSSGTSGWTRSPPTSSRNF